MQEKTLRKEYYENKLTQDEIANKYGVSRQLVIRYFKKYNLSPLKPYERNESQELTDIQFEFMIGTMLGDGCLQMMRASRNSWLTIKHCEAQREYVEWKHNIMKSFTATEVLNFIDYAHGKEYEKYYFRTICHPIFTELHNIFYDSGVKVVTNEICDLITPFSVAVWFMDDGFASRRHLVFATESFTEPELARLQNMFKNKFNIYTSLWFSSYRKGSNQKMYKIAILRKSVDDLAGMIRPYIIPSMMYKLDRVNSEASETRREAPLHVGEGIVQTLINT